MKRFSFLLVLILSACGGEQQTQSASPAGSYRLTSLICGDYVVPLEGLFSSTVTLSTDGVATIENETPHTGERGTGCIHRTEANYQQQGENVAFSVVESECRDNFTNTENICEIVFPLDGARRMIQKCGGGPAAGRFTATDGVLTAAMKPTPGMGAFSCTATYER